MSAAQAEPNSRAPRGPRFPWTDEGILDRLVTLWTREGKSAGEIADDLGARTGQPLARDAVLGKLHRLGLTGHGARSVKKPDDARAGASDEPAEPLPEPLKSAPNAPEMTTSAAPPLSDAAAAETMKPADASPPAVDRLPYRAPPAKAEKQQPPRPPGRYHLVDLRIGQCRFATTAFGAREHRFCGAPVDGATSWCAEHAEVVFDRTPAAERRAARIKKLIERKAA